MVLRDCGQALVQQVLEAVVIRLDAETTLWAPMSDRLNQSDQFALIGSKSAVSRRHRPTEECDRVSVLNQHRPEAVGRRVALHHERLGEIGHGQHRGRGHRSLEVLERRSSLCVPGEALLFEQAGERCRHGAIVVDEFAVIPRQAEETPHRLRRARHRPVVYGLYLGRVRGHASRRDHVAEVGDRRHPELTLGTLDEEDVAAELTEDRAEVTEMVGP